MFRTLLPAALVAAACMAIAPAARADAFLTLDGPSSSSIESGQSFAFAIRMTGVDVASYLVPVVVAGSAGSTPGVDFDLTPPSAPPASGYVFTGSTGLDFTATLATNPASPTSLFLTIGDYISPGQSPQSGTSDLVSWITVTTSSTFVGTITVEFGSPIDFEILDSNGDDSGFQWGGLLVVAVGPAGVIPEPASVAMLAVGGLAVAGLARRRPA